MHRSRRILPYVSSTRRSSRLAYVVGLVSCALLGACLVPTSACGCAVARTGVLFAGSVRTTTGAPIAGATIRAQGAVAGSACPSGVGLLDTFNADETRTDSAGAFRHAFYSAYAPRVRCVRIIAYRTQPGVSDSTDTALAVTFRAESERLDSLRIDLVLP
jgi:hypothetical protein